jgi:hypothetical protein
MKYDEAMATPDAKEWEKAVDKEHERMVNSSVFKATPLDEVPDDATILTETWAMKKKANGIFRARVTARGYEQIDGEHFDSTEIAAPVVAEMTIHILFILIMMALLHAQLMDVIGAFLLGHFNPKHKMYMRVPRGFEKFYPPGVVLLLERTLYGTRQAAMAFWKKALEVMAKIKMKRSNADPCLYYKWTDSGLLFWASWVDDFLGAGQMKDIIDSKEAIKSQMECEDAGELLEYIGCKLDKDVERRTMKITQPVLLQSLKDEFELPDREYTIPAPAGEVLHPDDPGDELLDPSGQTKYRSGVGKLMHMAKWSRPDILNAVRELSKFMTIPRQSHLKAMLRCMKYVVLTPDVGLVLKPKRKWDGKDKNFEFEISGMADAEYAKDTESRRSVSGYCTFLEGAVVSAKSKQQRCVTLSTTEAEMMAMTDCVQDMMFIRDVLQSMELKVKFPMVIYCDNKGAVDLVNNWSTSGRTRHIATKTMFLREMKEKGILKVEWIPNEEMVSDVFTKNLGDKDFFNCVKKFVSVNG